MAKGQDVTTVTEKISTLTKPAIWRAVKHRITKGDDSTMTTANHDDLAMPWEIPGNDPVPPLEVGVEASNPEPQPAQQPRKNRRRPNPEAIDAKRAERNAKAERELTDGADQLASIEKHAEAVQDGSIENPLAERLADAMYRSEKEKDNPIDDPDALDDEGDEENEAADEGDEQEEVDDPEEQQEKPYEPPDPDSVHKVKIDGREKEVSYKELLRGYGLEASQTRKSQQAAALVRETNAVREQLDESITTSAQFVEAVSQFLSPEQLQLAAQGVNELAQRRNAIVAQQEAELQRQHQFHQQEFMRGYEGRLEAEKERVVEAIPEWKDQDKYERGMQELVHYGRAKGLDDGVLQAVGHDARLISMMRNSLLWEQMKSAPKGRIKPSETPVLRSGAVSRESGAERSRRASHAANMERLSQTGDVHDAANLFLQWID